MVLVGVALSALAIEVDDINDGGILNIKPSTTIAELFFELSNWIALCHKD